MTILQDDLNKEAKEKVRWGSHIPVCTALFDVLPITGVLELGAGLNSTPIFFNRTGMVTSIEADLGWVEKLRSQELIKEDANHRIVHHHVSANYKRSTIRAEISRADLKTSTELYLSVLRPEMNMLFVDCYAGFRLQALIDLHDKFDVIVYHDAEPYEDKWYQYSAFIPKSNYLHFADRSFLTHTGILVGDRLEGMLQQFENALQARGREFAAKFDAYYEFTFERIER